MSDNLREKTVASLIWSFLERIGQQGTQFIITIIMARLLMPEEFGLIAMLTIFMAVAQSFVDSGFGSALIQKKVTTYVDECSIFYFNIVVGAVAAALLCLAAPAIAAFYEVPRLTALTRVLSLNLLINSFSLIHTTLLVKRVDFKTQLKISMTAAISSGVLGVAMAFHGFGVWSLVAQSLGSNAVNSLLLWRFVSWRPRFVFSHVALISMFSYGSRLLVSGVLDKIFTNIYILVIGRLFTAADLGFYARAKSTQKLPVENLTASINRVTFPVFASISGDPPRLKNAVRKALTTLAMLNFPLMIGLAAVARPFIETVFSDRWLPCAPYLQLTCVVGLFYPLHAVNLNVLKAQGRSDLLLRLELLKKVIVIAAISVTWRWGIQAMLYGQIVTTMVAYYLNSYYTGKLIDYPRVAQLRDLSPAFAVALFMGAAVYLIGLPHYPHALVQLSVQVATGTVLYAAVAHFAKLSAYTEIRATLLFYLKSRRSLGNVVP